MWLAISCLIVVTAGIVGTSVYGLMDDRATLYARSEKEHKYEDASKMYYKWVSNGIALFNRKSFVKERKDVVCNEIGWISAKRSAH